MPARTATIPTPVLAVLTEATCEGAVLRLPGQLERPLYEQVDKVLRDLGATWDRAKGGHVFDGDAAERVEAAVLTGGYESPKANGYYPTPPPLAAHLVDHLASLEPGQLVLEPSAGEGALADAVYTATGRHPRCVEVLAEKVAVLRGKGHPVWHDDFLEASAEDLGGPFPRVVMNPPFDKAQDVAHVLHAWGMLAPGGRLVAIMAAGIAFRRDRAHRALRDLLEAHGSFEENPEGSFAAAGTGVRTVTVVLDRPAEEA